MSNFFNIRRAANFFVYDLKSAKNNFLLSLVICGLTPAICFAIAMVISLISKQNPAEFSSPVQFMSIFVGIVMAFVSFPAKQYGGLTEKRYGSDWLMLPASTFEKWLSIVLVSCVVFPVCLFALMLSCDWLLSVIFPSCYPNAIISSGLFASLERIGGDAADFSEYMPHINFTREFIIDFSYSVLYFVLGAVFFKQSKFAKSLLVLFGLSALMSFIMIAVFGSSSGKEYISMFENGNISNFINDTMVLSHIIDTLAFVLVGGGLYLRIRTLKH